MESSGKYPQSAMAWGASSIAVDLGPTVLTDMGVSELFIPASGEKIYEDLHKAHTHSAKSTKRLNVHNITILQWPRSRRVRNTSAVPQSNGLHATPYHTIPY